VGRRLGQHFLSNGPILERIARAVCAGAPGQVIEIGPGRGELTAHLLRHCQRLTAIEVDPALAAGLRLRFTGELGFTLVEGDVLATDLGQWGPAVVCGNLPYYITSPILERTLALGPLLRAAVFLIQKEVADRLAAGPNCRDYGYLTVSVQAQCRVERLFAVKAASFRPPPKVDSAAVRLTPLAERPVEDLGAFRAFLGRCFRMKRKTLRNNLTAYYGPAITAHPLAGRRAEQLSLDALAGLYRDLTRPDCPSPAASD
jgi:16S rRNA (adenine1518-N6/adenine1519-N6)-dimethyltransferase